MSNRRRKTKVDNAAAGIMCRWSQPSMPTGRGTNLSTMSGLSREVGRLRRNLNTEQKFIDQLTSLTTVDSANSNVLAITPPAQGDTQNLRDGNSIKVVRMDLNILFAFTVNDNDLTSQANQIFHWYIFRWKKTPTSSGSTPPTIGDIFLVDGNGNYSTLSLLNVNTNQNYQLMANGEVCVEPKTTVSGGTDDYSTAREMVHIVHNCEFHQYFSSTTAASITDNLCFMVFLASNVQNSGAGSASSYQASIRTWFVDN
jgi:hypothetical protein